MKYIIAILLLAGGGLIIANKNIVSAKYQQGLTIGASMFNSVGASKTATTPTKTACAATDSSGKGYSLTRPGTIDCPYKAAVTSTSSISATTASPANSSDIFKNCTAPYSAPQKSGLGGQCEKVRSCFLNNNSQYGWFVQSITLPQSDCGTVAASSTSSQAEYVTVTLRSYPANSGRVVSTGLADGPNKVKKGATIQVTAVPAAGYKFNGWTGDKVSSDSALTFTAQSDTNLIANFIVAPTVMLKITTQGEAKGSVSGGESKSYPAGTELSLKAVPANTDSVFNFFSVSSDRSDFPSYQTYMNPIDVRLLSGSGKGIITYNVTANFHKKAKEYILLTSIDGGAGKIKDTMTGKIVESVSKQKAGTKLVLQAIPDKGFRVSGWSGCDDSIDFSNGVITSNSCSVTMSSHRDVIVHLVQQ